MATAPSDLPGLLLDGLLSQAPFDILLLDRRLICRYAAPVGDAFLGQPRESLVGRPIAEIFPPAAAELRPTLQRTVREMSRWRTSLYEFRHEANGVTTEYCWRIQIQPFSMGSAWGMLMVLADACDLRDASAARDQLQAACDRLREQEAARRDGLEQLRTRLRSLLAPLAGYLQVLVRRPHVLGGQSPAAVIGRYILPQVDALVATIDELNADRDSVSAPTAQ